MKNWIEKRSEPRDIITIAAVAVMDGGLTRHPVSVLNLSRTGALIEVSEATELPPMLTLLFNHRMEACELVWQTTTFAGLRFADTHID